MILTNCFPAQIFRAISSGLGPTATATSTSRMSGPVFTTCAPGCPDLSVTTSTKTTLLCLEVRDIFFNRILFPDGVTTGSILTVRGALVGSKIRLNRTVFEPPRSGPTIWEIGVPDREAGEFYVPDPSPALMNKLYINSKLDRFGSIVPPFLKHDMVKFNNVLNRIPLLFLGFRFRQYGLWSRYSEIYPDGDPVYTVGASDYTRDWFFAHVTRFFSADAFIR